MSSRLNSVTSFTPAAPITLLFWNAPPANSLDSLSISRSSALALLWSTSYSTRALLRVGVQASPP